MGATHFSGKVIDSQDSPAVAAADFAAAAGFGSTATVTVTAGSNDRRGRVSVASSGTGQGANPTLVLTLKEQFLDRNGAALTPFGTCSRGDTAAAAGDWRITARTATTVTFTFVGTPVAAQTYILDYELRG